MRLLHSLLICAGAAAVLGTDAPLRSQEHQVHEQTDENAYIAPRLVASITRQLRPFWNAPEAPEAYEIVTVLSFDLKEDGSLDGSPQLVRQDGVTEANKHVAARHAERAIQAVRLAAPFDLPPEHYNRWKRIAEMRFDKRP